MLFILCICRSCIRDSLKNSKKTHDIEKQLSDEIFDHEKSKTTWTQNAAIVTIPLSKVQTNAYATGEATNHAHASTNVVSTHARDHNVAGATAIALPAIASTGAMINKRQTSDFEQSTESGVLREGGHDGIVNDNNIQAIEKDDSSASIGLYI